MPSVGGSMWNLPGWEKGAEDEKKAQGEVGKNRA